MTWDLDGRGERIRTSDPLVPNQVLYQAEPLPDRAVGKFTPKTFLVYVFRLLRELDSVYQKMARTSSQPRPSYRLQVAQVSSRANSGGQRSDIYLTTQGQSLPRTQRAPAPEYAQRAYARHRNPKPESSSAE